MELVARQVLKDCETALEVLRENPKSPRWRVSWVATVALLRMVGHALQKVDAGSDPKLKRIVEDHWKRISASKPEPNIFWDFIDRERKNVLKEYDVGARLNVTVRPGTVHIDMESGTQSVVSQSRPNLYDYVMGPGPFEGQDQRELVSEAIGFWDDYLGEIEREYEAANG